MGDKLRDVFPISVTFTKGDQPSGEKFSGWATQTNAGLQLAEKAIGDLWGDQLHLKQSTGTSYILSHRFFEGDIRQLQIANLARLIGPASAINPWRISNRKTLSIPLANGGTTDIPAGVNEFTLPVSPLVYYDENGLLVGDTDMPVHNIRVDSAAGANHIVTVLLGVDSNVFATMQTTKDAVVADGDYYIDMFGRVYTFRTTGTYTFSTTYYAQLYWDTYDEASMNVIPDTSEQRSGYMCTITADGDDFIVQLPEIERLPGYQVDGEVSEIGNTEAAPLSFRAELPNVLRSLGENDIIPDGFLYLWDTEATGLSSYGGAIIEGATYKKALVDAEGFHSKFVVSGVTLVAGSDRYRVITVGTSITELLREIRQRFDSHNHNDRRSGLAVDHENLSSSHIQPAEVSSVWSLTVDSPTSRIENNHHPQYLCRYGWLTDIDQGDDRMGQCDNAMLGDLFMATVNSDYAGNDYFGSSADSRKIIFGWSAGPSIYFESTGTIFKIQAGASPNLEVSTSAGQLQLSASSTLNLTAVDGPVQIRAQGSDIGIDIIDAYGIEGIALHTGALNATVGHKGIYIGANNISANTDVPEDSIVLVSGTVTSMPASDTNSIYILAEDQMYLRSSEKIRFNSTVASGVGLDLASANGYLQCDCTNLEITSSSFTMRDISNPTTRYIKFLPGGMGSGISIIDSSWSYLSVTANGEEGRISIDTGSDALEISTQFGPGHIALKLFGTTSGVASHCSVVGKDFNWNSIPSADSDDQVVFRVPVYSYVTDVPNGASNVMPGSIVAVYTPGGASTALYYHPTSGTVSPSWHALWRSVPYVLPVSF